MFQAPYQNSFGGYYPQSRPNYYAPQQQPGYQVQPVSSKEEAMAVIADPMAAGVLLPDLGHGIIYVKRFNSNTGTSDFAEFVLSQREKPDFVRADIFQQTIESLRQEIEGLKKAGVNNE